MSDIDDSEEEAYDDYEEENPYFTGGCTCPPECPGYENPEVHGWGSCGEKLPNGTDCPCEAGWEE